ncbi:hypothetical protein TNCV_2556391 [Trichonephila clavipes]|nr:hypothetical protein TNCV_2556391 [Trichonephila clavipes]
MATCDDRRLCTGKRPTTIQHHYSSSQKAAVSVAGLCDFLDPLYCECAMRYERALRHTSSTVVVNAPLVRPNSSIPLKSNPVVLDTTLNGGDGGWVSLTAHVMDAAIPDVLQPVALRYFGKTQGPVVKVLPLSRQRPHAVELDEHFMHVACGCGSLVIKVTTCHEFEPSPAEDLPCRGAVVS